MSDEERSGGEAAEIQVQVDGYNAGFAEELYERALRQRGVVPPSLAAWTGNGGVARAARPEAAPEAVESAGAVPLPGAAELPAEAAEGRLRVAAAAGALVAAHRDHGHLAARLDPLAEEPPTSHPLL